MILKKLLGEIMVGMGFVTRQQLGHALQRQRKIFEDKSLPEQLQRAQLVSEAQLSIDRAPLLGQLLTDMGFATKEQLEEALKEQEKMVEVYKSVGSENLGAAIEVGSIVNSTLDLAEVLTRIMEHVNRVTNSAASTLMLRDDKTGELVFCIPTGPKADKLTHVRLAPGKGIAGWVAEHEQALLIPDVREDPRFYPGIDKISGFETKSILCVPLKAKTKLIGVLEAINKVDGTSFTEEDELLLSIFAYQTAMAIENARLHGELKNRLEEETQMHKRLVEELAERGKVEAALRESENKYKTLTESSLTGIFIHQDGEYVFLNDRFADMHGYRPEEVLGRSHLTLVHPDERELVEQKASQRIKGETAPWRYEVRRLRKDGEVIWCEMMVTCIQYRGRPAIMGNIVDITERKRAEEGLRESEERYRSLVESTEDSIYLVDRNCRYLFMNKRYLSRFGLPPDKTIGNSYAEFHSEKDTKAFAKKVRKVFKTGKSLSYEYRSERDGRYFIRTLTPVKEPDGTMTTVTVDSKDITEHKEAEEALRISHEILHTVLNSIDADVCASDLESYEVLFMNKHMQDSFGRDLIGRQCYQVFRGERRPCAHCTNDRLVDANRESTGVLVWEDQNPITQRFYRNYDKAIRWIDGRLVRLQVATDITDVKQAEEEKKRLEAQLLQAQKMEAIGTLAGGIAHDFNNLLMAIQGNASLMLIEKTPVHPDYERLKNIEQGVKSGAELTRQLLGFAMGGKYEVKPADVNELIQRSSDMFGRTKKEITIHTKYQEGIWPVEVDRGQIEQALVNLYVNAWQAMPGGGELYLETENVTLDDKSVKPFDLTAGRFVKISVTDTGIGMDKQTQQRIFEPFFTTKEMGRGTGLGLASVYGIIKNHDGIITVHSVKGEARPPRLSPPQADDGGQGATFTIYLPASEKEVIKKEKVPEEILKGTETVLLVDDEDMVIEVAQEMLETLGYTVLIATGGKEAIDLYKKNPDKIGIVILDMIMPEMGGGEVYDRLKEINPDIRVLLSSGYSIDGQAKQILERGCDGFIQKPFDMREVSWRIREILEKE